MLICQASLLSKLPPSGFLSDFNNFMHTRCFSMIALLKFLFTGMAMTCGLVCNKDRKAPSDSDTVALYKKAGAIPVTVTNVPILCMWWESANHNFGLTKNPYDHRRTVGGSSGKFYF